MRLLKITFASLSVALLCISSATVTHADTITFTGSADTSNNPPAAPDIGRCGAPAPPNLLVSLNPGSGTSNLGSFTQTLSHCTNVATGNIFNGLFTFDFGSGNTFFGTVAGTITLPPIGGVAPFAEMFTLTGGTGLFAGASGILTASGTVNFITASSHHDFNGTINTIPEPATVLLLGTALAGVVLKVRRRAKASKTEVG